MNGGGKHTFDEPFERVSWQLPLEFSLPLVAEVINWTSRKKSSLPSFSVSMQIHYAPSGGSLFQPCKFPVSSVPSSHLGCMFKAKRGSCVTARFTHGFNFLFLSIPRYWKDCTIFTRNVKSSTRTSSRRTCSSAWTRLISGRLPPTRRISTRWE